ncbi:MAG: hypothetical protein RLZZ187_3533 [Pseudomonadota bacterium]
MSAGTSFFALEERLLLAAQPVVVVADGLPTVAAPIGGQAQFTVTFDNTANPGNDNIGYAPFIDLVLPKRGADGVAPGTPPSLDPTQPNDDDGVTFASASYLGIPLSATVLVFDANGNATHPLLRDANNNPVVVNASSFRVALGDESVRAAPGDQLVVLRLPFGSFVPEQPSVTVNITANVSNWADLGVALPVAARGGFAFGSDPLNNPTRDSPFAGPVVGNTITPTVLTVSKTYDWREGETATGPNFTRSFTISLDVVTGQAVSNIQLADLLPDGVVVSGTPTLSVLGVPVAANAPGAPVYDPITHTLTATIAGSLTGVAGSEVTMTVPFYVRDTLAPGTPANPVLDPITGLPRTLANNVAAEADWVPLDPRDAVTRIVIDPAGAEATVTAKSIATQKSQEIVTDVGPSGLSPGDTIRYTVDVQVSDYFRLGNVVLADVLSDGQSFVSGSAILTATERGTQIGLPGATFNAANITVANGTTPGTTNLTFRISDELVSRGEIDGGILFGGRVTGLSDAGGTTLTLVYDALVLRDYVATGRPLNQGDTLSNNVTVSAQVLDSSNNPTAGTPTDGSSSSATIAVGSPSKSVYAVNGALVGTPGVPVNANGLVQVTSGDTVTFRLTYALPQTSTPTFILTDFLPLPIFVATPTAPAAWSFRDEVSATAPALNEVKWGPNATAFDTLLGPRNPTIATNATANSISLDFGSLGPVTVQNTTVDLLFTVDVKDRPFGDGLLFTNVVQARETNTPGVPTIGVGLIQVELNEPNLKIYKGVVAKDGTSLGTFSPGNVGPAGVTFRAPGHTETSAFTGTISSVGTITNGGLASRPVNSDITNLDADDRVTFAIVVENTGNGPRGAFNVTVKDVLPAGFVVPTGGLNLRVTDGTGTALGHTLLADGLFGNGIQINDAANQGGLARFDATNGRNIAVITYDLLVVQAVQPWQVLRNAAEITHYAALENGTNRVNNEPPGDIKADATATIQLPELKKRVSATSEPSTDLAQGHVQVPDVAIGEIVDYTITITVPEGTARGLKLTDFLPLTPGRMEVVSASVTSIGANLWRPPSDPSSSPAHRLPSPTAEIGNTNPPGSTNAVRDSFNDQVVFDFGDVLNLADNTQDEKDTITLTVRARVLDVQDNAAGDTLVNIARLELANVRDPNAPIRLQVDAPIEVVEPGLRIDKSAPPAFRLPGETVDYRITLTNPSTLPNGESAFTTTAHNIVLTDALLDPYLELVPGSVTASPGITIVSTTDGTLRVELAALAVGASATVDFKARVLATTPAAVTLENTATATFSSLPGSGGRTGSVSDTVQVPVGPSLTKAIVSTSNPDTAMGAGELNQVGDPNLPDLAIGETVTYLLTITLPQGTTQNLVLSDTLPSGLQPIAPVRVLSLGAGLAASVQATSISGQVITVNFGTVLNSSDSTVNAADVIQVEVDARVTGTALVNEAGLGFTIGGRNGTLSANAPADPIAPQLTIGKTVAGVSGDAGDLFTYTVTVGHGTASQMPGYDITVRDTLDPRLIPVAVSSTLGTAAIAGQVVTLTNLPRLAQIEQAVLTYTVRFADTVQPGQRIGNTATLTYDSNPGTGGAPGTGSASAPELLVNMPIALTKAIVATSLPETGSAFFNPTLPDIAVGETVTYRLKATLSEGTQTLVIADTLPAGLVAESATLISVGAGITAAAPVITLSGQAVRFDFGTVVNTGSLVGGDDVEVQVVARLAPAVTAGAPLVNASVATVAGPDVPNSTLRAEAFAVAEPVLPQLVLTKAVAVPLVAVGDKVDYTLTLTHAPGSTGPGYGIVITDPLSNPALRLVAGSVATSSGSVTLGNGADDAAIRVAVPVLLPGQVVTIGFRATAISAPPPDGVVPNIGDFNAASAPGALPPGFDRPLSGSAAAFVRIGAGGLPPSSLVTEGIFSGYADEFRRLRENAFTAPAIFAGSSQPGAAVMLHLRDSEGGPITMMGVVADIGGHWIANPMQSGISGPADPIGLQLVRGLAGRDDGEDTILPPPPPARPAPTPTTMPYTLLADHTPASFDTRGTNTDVARLTFAGSIQPGGLFAGSPDAPGIAAAGAVGAALQKDLRGLAAPMSLGWNRFALDFAAATAAASVAGR